MSEIQAGKAVAKPTVQEIRTQELAAVERRIAEASGKGTEGGAEASVGKTLSLADHAKRVQQRAKLLETKLEGYDPNQFNYAQSMRRFNELLSLPGLINLVISTDSGFPSTVAFGRNSIADIKNDTSVNVNHELDILKRRAGTLQDSLVVDSDRFYIETLTFSLLRKLGKLSVCQMNPSTAEAVKEIEKRLLGFCRDSFSARMIRSLTVTEFRDIERIPRAQISNDFTHFACRGEPRPDLQEGTKIGITIQANPYRSATIEDENVLAFKERFGQIIKDTNTLCLKLQSLGIGHAAMSEAKTTIKEVKDSIDSLLKRSDYLLHRELLEIQAAKN